MLLSTTRVRDLSGWRRTLYLYAPCDSFAVLVVEVRTVCAPLVAEALNVHCYLALEPGGLDVYWDVRVDLDRRQVREGWASQEP